MSPAAGRAGSGLQIRDAGSDDFDAAWSLTRSAFGGSSDAERWKHRVSTRGRALVVVDGGTTVGFARLLPFAQWYGGREVPMGGVASVAVAPEARGRGVGRALVAALVPRLREAGAAVSALFPRRSASTAGRAGRSPGSSPR